MSNCTDVGSILASFHFDYMEWKMSPLIKPVQRVNIILGVLAEKSHIQERV